jgi:prepilin-type processing-associated H-X9-DG protein
VRIWSWVGDLVAAKYANPAKSLDPINRGKISEETAFYMGALDGHGKLNELRWEGVSKADGSPVDPAEEDHFKGTDYFGDDQTMWENGFNTNFVATWHFVRGDNNITSGDHYAVDASAHDDGQDPEMCPLDGDGPLSTAHLADSTFLSSADRIALLGPAQVGNHDHDHGEDHGGGHGHSEADAIIDADVAQAINTFVDSTGRKPVAKVGDPLVEGMTDGPAAEIETSLATPWGTGDGTRKVHTLADVVPIHKAKIGIVNPVLEDGGALKRMVGGSAPVLFADGHVARIQDSTGYGGRPDGWLGPFQGEPGAHEGESGHEFVLDAAALDEIRDQVWLGRIRTILTPGGGSSE